MLAAPNRLRAAADFAAVLAHRPHGGAAMLLRATKAPTGPLQVGFIVGKRFSLSAVVRNRARRRLREAVRAVLVTEPALSQTAYRVTVTAKAGATTTPLPELTTEFVTLLRRQGVQW